jgi:ABC-type oligopeptide transport system ATPase subunit
MYAFLGVKGSRVQIPPSRPELAGQKGFRQSPGLLFDLRGASRGATHQADRYAVLGFSLKILSIVTDPAVRVTGLAKRFHGIRDRRAEVVALDGVSMAVEPGEVLGIVGESGSGKTTLARCLAALTMPSEGSIEVCGVTWTDRLNRDGRRKLSRNLQLVFQDPYTSLSPRMRTGSLVGEGLRVHHLSKSRKDERDPVASLVTSVGLGPELARSYPRELFGGQRQRVASPGRSRSTRRCWSWTSRCPRSTSIQAQILNLVRDLTAQRSTSTPEN